MRDTIIKSWATTAIGAVLLIYMGYKLYLDPTLSAETVFGMLAGLGFIASKDGTASHTKK